MTFVDDLAVVQVLLLLAAAVLAYSGVMVWWAIRSNRPDQLTKALRGAAVPLGVVGVAMLSLGLWGEMTWPFPATGMAGYNIFFFDPMLLMGLVLISYAVATYFSLRLQYVGLFSLIAGSVTAFYGWTGYTATPAFTKDPFDTLLLYAGFGLAGVLAFPATVIVDYYRSLTEGVRTAWQTSRPAAVFSLRHFGTRGAQPAGPAAAGTEAAAGPLRYRMPPVLQVVLLLFPVFAGLAAIAALWYFGVTLPGHLGSGPGAAP